MGKLEDLKRKQEQLEREARAAREASPEGQLERVQAEIAAETERIRAEATAKAEKERLEREAKLTTAALAQYREIAQTIIKLDGLFTQAKQYGTYSPVPHRMHMDIPILCRAEVARGQRNEPEIWGNPT